MKRSERERERQRELGDALRETMQELPSSLFYLTGLVIVSIVRSGNRMPKVFLNTRHPAKAFSSRPLRKSTQESCSYGRSQRMCFSFNTLFQILLKERKKEY